MVYSKFVYSRLLVYSIGFCTGTTTRIPSVPSLFLSFYQTFPSSLYCIESVVQSSSSCVAHSWSPTFTRNSPWPQSITSYSVCGPKTKLSDPTASNHFRIPNGPPLLSFSLPCFELNRHEPLHIDTQTQMTKLDL